MTQDDGWTLFIKKNKRYYQTELFVRTDGYRTLALSVAAYTALGEPKYVCLAAREHAFRIMPVEKNTDVAYTIAQKPRNISCTSFLRYIGFPGGLELVEMGYSDGYVTLPAMLEDGNLVVDWQELAEKTAQLREKAKSE